jgi:hypothetical protein
MLKIAAITPSAALLPPAHLARPNAGQGTHADGDVAYFHPGANANATPNGAAN